MSLNFRTKTTTIKKLKDMYAKAPERTTRAIYDALEKTGNKVVENTVNQIKRKKLVDSGKLLQSVRTYPLSGFKQVIEVGAEYAASLEEGSAPHYVPIKPLKRWAKRKLGKEFVAYIVQKNIAERGTEGRYYFRDSINKSLPQVTKYWDDIFDKVFK